MIIWDKEDKDVSNDDLRMARHQRPLDGGDELPHADRARAAGSDIGRVITPELVFFSIMTGFGLILIAGTLLGVLEVGHE